MPLTECLSTCQQYICNNAILLMDRCYDNCQGIPIREDQVIIAVSDNTELAFGVTHIIAGVLAISLLSLGCHYHRLGKSYAVQERVYHLKDVKTLEKRTIFLGISSILYSIWPFIPQISKLFIKTVYFGYLGYRISPFFPSFSRPKQERIIVMEPTYPIGSKASWDT